MASHALTVGDDSEATTNLALVQAGPSLQAKFLDLRDTLNGELVERTHVVDTAILALLSKTHHYQLGVPGVAKSLTVRSLVSHIGDFPDEGYYEMLLSRFTTPEEMVGPPSLLALKEDRMRRVTAGMLPVARVAFLDEIFKANSANLNSLLTILNERLFRNDGRVDPVPLWSMFCASNELPESEELNALFDRIHFRHVVRPISEAGNFIAMLARQGGSDVKILTWAEIEEAYDEVSQVTIPMAVLEGLYQVRALLKDKGIEPTDRRFAESLRVIKASAWLDGQTEADIEHTRPLRHMLWDTQEHITTVERILLELANPLDKEAMDLLIEIEKIAAELELVLRDDYDKQAKNKKGIELHSKVNRAKVDLESILTRAKDSGAKRRSEKALEAKALLLRTTKLLLKELFGIVVDKTEAP